MKRFSKSIALISMLFLSLFTFSYAQKVETKDGVRLIHNGKTGKWGKHPKVSIEFIKTIGDIESEDGNVLFFMPGDIAFDSQGNIYVLDSGNHRIQKFNPEGKYITTIGNKGQGPGEFQYPLSLDVDLEGLLYIADPGNKRIQILKPDGSDHKTIKMIKEKVGTIRKFGSDSMLMGGGGVLFFEMSGDDKKKAPSNLLKVLNLEGETQEDFIKPQVYKNFLMNKMGNQFHFTIDNNDNIYVSFGFQNRIEKYSSDGKIVWKSDRKLNFDTTKPKGKGIMKRSGGAITIRAPQMNRCSNGIAVDDQGRIWVVSLKRQMREEEAVGARIQVTASSSGDRTMSMKPEGNTDVRKTDMYQLEVYDPEGILLGKIHLDHFVDDIRIYKDKIYLLDKMRGAQYYEYKIVEQ